MLNHAKSIIPMKERWGRLRMLSMMSLPCQHVATLQFVSSAETDSASSKRRTASFVSDQTDLSSVATHGDEYDWICIIVICVSLWLRKQRQRFAQDQPKGYFETKVFELLLNHAKSIIPMKERWGRLRMVRYDKFNLPACGNIAIWQLRRERQPLWNSHDGLNLTCLDQCHGVPSHGTSSSPGRRNRIALLSTV